MKILPFIALILFQINSFGQNQIILLNDDCPTKASVKYIEFVHIESKVNEGDYISEGQTLGIVSNPPDTLSRRFNNEINLSKQAYNQRDFLKAASQLETAYKKEASNPFVLDNYARALYQIENKREESYQVYQTLIQHLDNKYHSNDTVVIVDAWFKEAYWKLGTLHMDYGNWENALYEIGRFVGSIQNEKREYIYEQALSYLTECAYMLGNKDLCIHFANRTLHYNPKNTYVQEFTSKLNR